MPIIEIEIVGPIDDKEIARPLAETAAEILRTGPGKTWVKIYFLPANQYAENGERLITAHPVFVSVLSAAPYETQEKAQFAVELAAQFSKILSRPAENIHVLFEPPAVGRIAFGGKLKTELK